MLELRRKARSDEMKIFKSQREKRIESCRSNLARRLDSEVTGDCVSKITWLVCHLEEYLERWLAFAQMETLTVKGTLNNDLFLVTVVATGLINTKADCLGTEVSFPREEWKHFCNTLEWIQKSPNRSELKLISDTFESFLKMWQSMT